MKASYSVGLVAIAAAGVLAGALGYRSYTAAGCTTCNRLITIYDTINGACEVDFPVAVVRDGLKPPQTIQWQTNSDKPYYINFKTLRYKVGNPPANYTPRSPLRDSKGNVVDNIYVTKSQPSDQYVVAYDASPSSNSEPNYYYYAIYAEQDPTTNSNNPCKEPFSDHDTGVNVKR